MYPEVAIKYINGRNPDLIIDEKERIDLTKYKSVGELHELFISKGFRKEASPSYKDTTENCLMWAQNGQCSKNKEYMDINCKYSCNKLEL